MRLDTAFAATAAPMVPEPPAAPFVPAPSAAPVPPRFDFGPPPVIGAAAEEEDAEDAEDAEIAEPADESDRLLDELVALYEQQHGSLPTEDVLQQWRATLADAVGLA